MGSFDRPSERRSAGLPKRPGVTESAELTAARATRVNILARISDRMDKLETRLFPSSVPTIWQAGTGQTSKE